MQSSLCGFVIGRYLKASGPTPEAASGVVRFTRVNAPTSTFLNSRADDVVAAPVDVPLDEDGWLHHEGSEGRGVWLAAGRYDVDFHLDGPAVPGFRLDVIAEHTEQAPLILNTARRITKSMTKGKAVDGTAFVFADGHPDGDAIALLDESDLYQQ